MARGLLEQGAPKQAAGPGGQASSDQQRQTDLFIQAGKQIIGSDQVQQQIANIKGDPIEQLGGAVLMVMTKLEGIAQDAGEKLDPDAELMAANALLGDIIKSYEQATGQAMSEDQKGQILSYAVSTYIADAVQTGKISKEELQQLANMAKQSENGKQIAAQVEQAVGQANNQAMAAAGEGQGADMGQQMRPAPARQARPQRAGLLA